MTVNSITINGVTVSAGLRETIDLPLGKLYTHAPLSMPVHVICGKRPGARLFVSATADPELSVTRITPLETSNTIGFELDVYVFTDNVPAFTPGPGALIASALRKACVINCITCNPCCSTSAIV